MSDPEHVLRGYIAYLERGASTHASYAQAAQDEAVQAVKELSAMASNRTSDAEDGIERHDSDLEIVAMRVELLNLQASTHTVGLSVCLVGLAVLAAMGKDVSQAPPLPKDPPA